MTGAACASLFAILIYNLLKMSFIKLKFGLNPYNFHYILVLVIAVILYFIVSYIPKPENFVVEIVVDSIITIVLFLLFHQVFAAGK